MFWGQTRTALDDDEDHDDNDDDDDFAHHEQWVTRCQWRNQQGYRPDSSRRLFFCHYYSMYQEVTNDRGNQQPTLVARLDPLDDQLLPFLAAAGRPRQNLPVLLRPTHSRLWLPTDL